VWIVYVEHNENAEPSIEGVYATKRLATLARHALVRAYRTGKTSTGALHPRKTVWPTRARDDDDEWDVDVHIEAHEVQGT
jgi:hypothetical protein